MINTVFTLIMSIYSRKLCAEVQFVLLLVLTIKCVKLLIAKNQVRSL